MHPIDWITGSIFDSAMRITAHCARGFSSRSARWCSSGTSFGGGFRVERQMSIGLEIEGLRFENAFVLDLLVDSRVVVEIKSVERLAPIFEKQLQTYLRLPTAGPAS